MDILLHPNLSYNSWMQYSTALVNLDPDGNALPDHLDEQKQANCSMHLLWGGKKRKKSSDQTRALASQILGCLTRFTDRKRCSAFGPFHRRVSAVRLLENTEDWPRLLPCLLACVHSFGWAMWVPDLVQKMALARTQVIGRSTTCHLPFLTIPVATK